MAPKLGDIRFDGFSNAQLADQVNKLKQGPGNEAVQSAIDTLHSVAQDLDATNQILTTQMAKIGIDWHSVAGQGGQQQLASTVNYGDQSQYHIDTANSGLATQSDSYAVAKTAPAPSTDTDKTTMDNVAGFFGYQTDHAKEVEQAQADRDQAIAQLNAYQSNSQDAIASTTPMSAPPNIGLVAQPVQGASINSVGGYGGTASGYAGPGGGGYGGYSATGVPGGGGYAPPGGVPGGGVPGPGGVTGVGPGTGRLPGALPPAAAAASGLLAEEVGLGAALAGGAGAVAAGARSGNPNAMVRGGGTNAAPGEKGNTPSKASATAGAIDEEEAARARTAERIGPQGRAGSSMMQPGAAGGKGKKEEDSEHDRKYTVEEDLFGDHRLVAPTVLGEDPDA